MNDENNILIDEETANILEKLANIPEDPKMIIECASIDPETFSMFLKETGALNDTAAETLLRAAIDFKKLQTPHSDEDGRVATIRILIICEQPLLRIGVRQTLAKQTDFEIIEAQFIDDLPAVIEKSLPDVILLDIELPSLIGLQVGRILVQQYPISKLMVLTPEINNEELFEAIRIGAAAYLDKNAKAQDLEGIIRRVSHGEYPINDSLLATPKVAEHVLKQFQEMVAMGMAVESITAPLSNRETQILRYVADGNSNKKIAQILDISEQTIKKHISSILRKLNDNDKVHAVMLAIRQGLPSIDESHIK